MFDFFEKVNKGHVKLVSAKTIKNSQVSLYCHFNKIIKWPGTSFQSATLTQKHIRNVCQTAQLYLTKYYLGFKCNFHYAAMSMMTPEILKSVDFTKT